VRILQPFDVMKKVLYLMNKNLMREKMKLAANKLLAWCNNIYNSLTFKLLFQVSSEGSHVACRSETWEFSPEDSGKRCTIVYKTCRRCLS